MKKAVIWILFLALALPTVSFSQIYATSNKKAIKYFEDAQRHLQLGEFDFAEQKLQLALDKDEQFLEAYIVLGETYMIQHKDEDALAQFQKALTIRPDVFPPIYFKMGQIEIDRGNYSEAKKNFTKFLSFEGRTTARMERISRQNLANCEFAPNALETPVPFEPKNLGPNINSERAEYYPCLTADEEILLYTRNLNGSLNSEKANEDFFVSQRFDGEWRPARSLTPPINSSRNEGAPTLSADGQLLIFTACEIFGDYGPDRKGLGSCDLFASKRIGNKWSNVVNLGRSVNSQHWETQPSWSSDGKTLYFIRGKGRTDKQQDIYKSELSTDGVWSRAEKLSDVINTPGREESVFIHPDGRTLYFSSTGHPGMGGLDIFMSRLDNQGNWSKPVNLGYPINTFGDENSLLVGASGETAYFASDREGGYGELDLYSFKLPEEVRPLTTTYMKGTVRDMETKKPLEARFELVDLETGEVVVRSKSNKGNGQFLVTIPADREYALSVERKDYLFYSENFTFPDNGTATEPFHKIIDLQQIQMDGVVVMKNIFFDTDKYDLKTKSVVELKKLLDLLVKNPGLKIEIRGHTDNEGDEGANQILSENRAKAVFDYLMTQGIGDDRLSYKGFGETLPIESNDTEEGRANNRRTEFRVTGL